MKRFLLGCCYYPEHWRPEDMEPDFRNMKEMGFQVVRMGEFAWSLYEPQEGIYDFDFLLKAIACAEKYGISVILGTPTAAPPKWLTEKHPEVLCVNKDRQQMGHGSRQQHNHTSKVYLEYCRKIVTKMAEAVRDCKNVIGWQIDNEFNCGRSESYADSDDEAFRNWLRKKYGTIDRLNQVWGTRFWSLEFTDFDQITCPSPVVPYLNPTWKLDFLLFTSDAVIEYAKVQHDVLRKITPDKFITHNGMFHHLDNKKLTDEALDFFSFDSYPAFGERKGIGMGRQWGILLSRVRGISSQFMVPEQQAGPGGQLEYMVPTPLPGQIRLWTYQSIAHGAAGILYFRWRTAVYGAEQLWYGIYDHDGRENYRSREIRAFAPEVLRIGELLRKEKQTNQVAIYYDYVNVCDDEVESFTQNDAAMIYDHLDRKNIKCDFIYDLDEIPYKVVIVPHLTIADESAVEKLEAFSKRGGVVILSARSGMKNKENQYRRSTPPGVFSQLAGAEVEWFTVIPSFLKQTISFGGKEYEPKQYLEVLRPTDGEVLGVYTEEFYKGKAAIVKRGNVYYIGTYCDWDTAEIYAQIIKPYLDPLFEVQDRDLEVFYYTKHLMVLNYSQEEKPLGKTVFDLISQKKLDAVPPFGAVLMER